MAKIVLESNCEFEDTKLREWVGKLETKIETLNNRTKSHTLKLREIEKELKGGKRK